MRVASLVAATALTLVARAAPDQPPPRDSTSVDVTSFGAVGDGVHDDTAAFAAAAATGRTVRVPRPAVHYKLTSRVRLLGSLVGVDMPEIRMFGADGRESHSMFEVRDHTGPGLVISGVHLDGQWDGVSTHGEWSHLILVKGSRNITIENNLLERPYGDCILLGGEGHPSPSENVVIRNNRMRGPRRCNVALISVRNVSIIHNVIEKTSRYVTAIDLEPNPNGVDSDWGVEISENRIDVTGVAIMLYHVPEGVPPNGPGGDVTITGNTARADRFLTKVGDWVRVNLSKNAY